MLPLPFIAAFLIVPLVLSIGIHFFICVRARRRWKCGLLPGIALLFFIPAIITWSVYGTLSGPTAGWLALLLLGTGICILLGCGIGLILYRVWRKRQ